MQAEESPLLLLVQANVVPEHEAAFNTWYYNHVPTLLEIPGYEWGRRYVGVVGDVKYLALYQIADRSCLERLIGPEAEKRDPIANREFDRFGTLEGLSDLRINVYRQISGTHLSNPLLAADHPVSVVMADCADPAREEAFNAWYDQSHVPNLVRIPGYVSGARFRLLDDPALEWLGMGPRYLALYELENLDCLPDLTDPETMRPEARAEFERFSRDWSALFGNMSWNVYRPIARHWRLGD